jgi:hypothetical protein
MPSGPVYVIACADDLKAVAEKTETNNCAASSTPFDIVPGPSSADLIDKDVANGLLTPEQALVDKVFAAFGDSRLPAKYHGDDGSVIDSSEAIAAAAAAFGSASPQTKAILVPFLKAPAYPNTWENLPTAPKPPEHQSPSLVPGLRQLGRAPVPHPSTLGEPGWEYYQHPKGVRIWFRTGDQHMQSFARLLYFSIDDVWKLTTLMGRSPVSDAGPHPYNDPHGVTKDWGDGGSGDLDIYFADMAKPAVTQAYPPACTDTPSFIVMDPNISYLSDPSRVIHILAHEFMHVLQFTYHYADACDEYTKLDEATAQWAIDYVVPHNDHEHATDAFLPNPGAALWQQSYDGWPFEQFLARTESPTVVRALYENTQLSGPWDALNDAVPGGLDKQWSDFAVKAWNQPPVAPSFKQWDALPDVPVAGPGGGALEPTNIELGGSVKKTIPIPTSVPALTRKYDIYTIDPDVGRIEYLNGLAGKPHAGVRALVQLTNGTWKLVQNWSNRASVAFCTDNPSEDVKKLVVITTDSTVDDLQHVAQTSGTKIVATSDCLPDTFTGTFSGEDDITSGGAKITFSGSATLKRASVGCGKFTCYELVSGSMTWQYGTLPGSECTYQSDPRITPLASAGIHLERTKGPDGKQTYDIGFQPQNDSAPGTVDCGNGPGDTTFNPPNCCVLDPNKPPPVAAQDGWLLNGSATKTIPDIEEFHSSWSFSGHGPP